MSPRPSTAVPSVTTATRVRLPGVVVRRASGRRRSPCRPGDAGRVGEREARRGRGPSTVERTSILPPRCSWNTGASGSKVIRRIVVVNLQSPQNRAGAGSHGRGHEPSRRPPATTSARRHGTAPSVHESTPSRGLSRSTHQPSPSRTPSRFTRQRPVRQPDDARCARVAGRAVAHEQPVARVVASAASNGRRRSPCRSAS